MADYDIPATKQCSKCREEKSLSAFGRSPRYRDGHRGQCIKCRATYNTAYGVAWRKANPAYYKTSTEVTRRRRIELRLRFRLTEADWQGMLDAQQDRCAICHTDKPKGRWSTFHVDHCHNTGRVRGLLCQHCNTTLGRVRDDVTVLRAMIAYIERHENNTSAQLTLPDI